MTNPSVGIIMGSQSDWATMREAAVLLDELGVTYEKKIVSAHRTPDRLWTYGKTAVDRGLQVIIAGAGGAAHLHGIEDPRPCHRCTRPDQSPVGGGFTLFDFTDAARVSGCDHGHRRCGGSKRGLDGGRHFGATRPRSGQAVG